MELIMVIALFLGVLALSAINLTLKEMLNFQQKAQKDADIIRRSTHKW